MTLNLSVFSPLCHSCISLQNPFQGCVQELEVVQLRPPLGKQKVLLAIMFPLDFCLWKGNVLHLCTGWGYWEEDLSPREL